MRSLILIAALALSAVNAAPTTTAETTTTPAAHTTTTKAPATTTTHAAATTTAAPATTVAPSGTAQPAPTYVPTGTFTFKQAYPSPGSVPVPKPEWVAALDKTKIATAPVIALQNGSPVNPTPGSDPYCDWTFGGCTRADDIFQCKKGDWGITYDDGPTAFSPKLYDYLDSVNQKATLFVIGGQVLQFPELLQRAYKSGHEIAIHGFSHSYLTSQTTEQIVGELRWTEEVIKEVIGVSPKLFRPPYGDIDNRVRDIALQLGYTPVIWNHDTDDWKLSEAAGFDAAWIDGNATQWANEAATATVGGLSLEHDLYAGTVDAAIRILPMLKKAYNVVPVGQCSGLASVYKEGVTSANATASNATSSGAASNSSVAPAASGSAAPKPTSGATSISVSVVGAAAIAAAACMLI
ncbi:chitin deacetylase [Umbelopsis nana]